MTQALDTWDGFHFMFQNVALIDSKTRNLGYDETTHPGEKKKQKGLSSRPPLLYVRERDYNITERN